MTAPTYPPPTRSRVWWLPVVVALLAITIRILIIALLPDGREDLEIYYSFGNLMAQGRNPYTPPLDGTVDPQYANISPVNLALFAVVLKIWDSPTALRLLFALVDGAVILTIGYLVQRPRAWRQALMWFYALNPFVLMTLVVMSEDKVVVIWMTLLLIVSVEAGQRWSSVLLTTLITLYRWLGAFYILPVALYFARSWRSFASSVAIFGAIFALSHAPYWPDNLHVYESRAARALFNPPFHSSPTMLLAEFGVYSPHLVPLSIILSLALLYTLFMLRRISLVETILLSTFFTNIFAPELPFSRITMIALPLLLLVELSRPRLVLLWALTVGAALFVHIDLAWNVALATTPSLKPIVLALAQPIPNMLLMNLLPALLLVYYAQDRRRGVVSRETRLAARALRLPLWERHNPARASAPQRP